MYVSQALFLWTRNERGVTSEHRQGILSPFTLSQCNWETVSMLSGTVCVCLSFSGSHSLLGFFLSTLLSAKSEHTVTVNCEVLQMTHQLARAAGSSAVARSTGVHYHQTKR